MHARTFALSLSAALLSLLFASCASQDMKILSLSGCIVEPKPRPGPPPNNGPGVPPQVLAAIDYEEYYLYIDQSYTSKKRDKVQFEFTLRPKDTLLVGPPSMEKGDDYFDLASDSAYTIQVERVDEDTLKVTMLDSKKKPIQTKKTAYYFLIEHPFARSYTGARMKIARLSRLNRIEYESGKELGALEMAFEAFAVPTGLTLLSDRLCLMPRWQSKRPEPGLIACVRPRPVEFDPDPSSDPYPEPPSPSPDEPYVPSYHTLEYEVIQQTDTSYIIEFDLDLGGDVFLAPLDDVRGDDPILLPKGKGKVTLSHQHRSILQNRTVMEISHDGTKAFRETFKTGSPVLRMSGQAITPLLKHLGKRTPPVAVPEKVWDVIAVQLDGVGVPAGFLIITKDLKLRPDWMLEN